MISSSCTSWSTTESCNDGLALDWLYTQADLLRTALASAGVTDPQVQRQVAESYLWTVANDFDGTPVEEPSLGHRPLLAFRRGAVPGSGRRHR